MAVRGKKVKSTKMVLTPLQYGDDYLNVSFYKNAYTPRLETESNEDSTTAGEILMKMLLPVLAEWDFYNDYDVYQYQKAPIPDGAKNTRLFVINGPAGKLGEWNKYITRNEKSTDEDSDEPTTYELVPIFQDGEPLVEERIVPITQQGLLDVPLSVMNDIIKAIGEAMSPGEAKSSNSDSSF